MQKPKDNFSKQADFYKKYRPTYPKELYEDILEQCEVRGTCWDCGTGNGQVAQVLSNYFDQVHATDISKAQISKAYKHERIQYSIERAEKTGFKSNQFDLITVAQAAHWFDIEQFNMELNRVAKSGAVAAIWGYGLLQIELQIDGLINDFYKGVVGRYWDLERQHIDTAYKSIPFKFNEIRLKRKHWIKVHWTLADLQGYFNSWSSVQNYIKKNHQNPVPQFIDQIGEFWGNQTVKEIRFPLFTRIGTIDK